MTLKYEVERELAEYISSEIRRQVGQYQKAASVTLHEQDARFRKKLDDLETELRDQKLTIRALSDKVYGLVIKT